MDDCNKRCLVECIYDELLKAKRDLVSLNGAVNSSLMQLEKFREIKPYDRTESFDKLCSRILVFILNDYSNVLYLIEAVSKKERVPESEVRYAINKLLSRGVLVLDADWNLQSSAMKTVEDS